jgi:predicted DNA-binding antitoxin AbrB/MazE fold protein
MGQLITATFEDGVLKPDGKLDLAAGAKVQLVVTSVDAAEPSNEPTSSESRLTRDQLHERPTLYSRREKARERIQREWEMTFQQRQRAFEEMERLRTEHPIDTRGERLTRDQLHERH